MNVLLTNDDGIDAAGLWSVYEQLQRDPRITSISIIAPAVEQSGVSHSVTYLEPLVPRRCVRHGHPVWIVPGTPADCVKLGLVHLLDPRPDVVISGMNAGLNSGMNIIYSGTVGAAREANFFNIPSVAVSLEEGSEMNFQAAAQLVMGRVVDLFSHVLKQPLARGTGLININVPQSAVAQYDQGDQPRWEAVGMKLIRHDDEYAQRTDPRGRSYYWSTDQPCIDPSVVDTDVDALAADRVTVTPLQFDLTDYDMLKQLQGQLH